MRKKGFTLVELLVVIAIIALLMGILMPALSRVKQLAYQMVCGSNLSGLGKACMIYTNDFDDDFPVSGGQGADWAAVLGGDYDPAWESPDELGAYFSGSTNAGTITGSLFLLVKYADVTPAQFLCKGDDATAFVLGEHSEDLDELSQAWDFGPYNSTATEHKPTVRVSYSYHQPFGTHGINALSSAGMAIMADRNPFIANPFYPADTVAYGTDEGEFNYDYNASNSTMEKNGNCMMHQRNGQNVVFLDSSVRFESRVFCGVNNDNIYAVWVNTSSKDNNRARGYPPSTSQPPSNSDDSEPVSRTDSFLVHETEEGMGKITRQ